MKSKLALFAFASLALVGCYHAPGQLDFGGPGDLSVGDASPVTTMPDGPIFAFDLAVSCTPIQCQPGQCGPIADGCGSLVDCGGCATNESCGGGGTPSVCGTPCVKATCASLGNLNCGTQSDGCGGTIDCGKCSAPDTCGGGGTPSVCGNAPAPCKATTCMALGYTCGDAGDGCGGTLHCGTCMSPQICGGGGVSSQCGAPPCTPTTCSASGAKTCGPIGNGCGGVIQCGGCNQPETCGGSTAGQCSVPASCTNLCLQQTTCSNPATTTTLSGTVYAPNGVDPLPNVLVYVPNGAVQPFTPGVACETCASNVSGSPLVSAATDTSGHFQISNMPVGMNIPLVIQTGRWRRQITVPSVTACQDNAADPTMTRLPRNQSEGDIPLMAFVTGRVDVLECVMRKIGIDDGEFTGASGTGRVHLYKGDGMTATFNRGLGGAVAPGTPDMGGPNEDDLTNTYAELARYDMVLFPCKGDEYDRPMMQQTNLINYANAGGRIFATHFSYTWLYNDAPFSMTAAWDINQYPWPVDQTGYINQGFPKGLALAQWLQNIGASTTLGQIPIGNLKMDFDSITSKSTSWLSIKNDPMYGTRTMHFTFNTPVNSPSASQCGRVLFDNFHVENVSSDMTYNAVFPAECPTGVMTAQEKLLEYMIFDLGSCVTPDVPVCNKTTCNAQNIHCGPAGDGCGGLLDCGMCPNGQTCGGGGVPNQCGSASCTKNTCSAQGFSCGPASDGCGGVLDCGMCPSGQTCGGGGTPGKCGTGTCKSIDCGTQGIQCGPAGDGCGNQIDCGMCPSGQTCGGGGMPGKCGALCVPKTCQQLGFNCGPAGDGCGGALQCGTCSVPQTCGGGGMPNVCGGGVIQ